VYFFLLFGFVRGDGLWDVGGRLISDCMFVVFELQLFCLLFLFFFCFSCVRPMVIQPFPIEGVNDE